MIQTDKSQTQSKKTMIFGFIAMLIMVILLVSGSIYLFDSSVKNLKKVAESNAIYLATVNQMHTAARERIVSLYKLVSTEDYFERDEIWMDFNEFGTEFIVNRNKLLDMPISKKFRTLLLEQDKYTQPVGRVHKKIADLAMTDNLTVAKKLLLSEAVPLQNKLLFFFGQLTAEIEQQENRALHKAADFNNYAKYFNVLISMAILLLLYLISRKIYQKVTDTETKLVEEKQRAQVTLHSIADGVLLLDNQGYIKELNNIAESLLAIDTAQAYGQHINEIVHLYEEQNEQDCSHIFSPDSENQQTQKSEGWVILRNKNDHRLAVGYSVSPVKIDNKVVGLVCVIHDISAVHELAKQLDFQANHDELTGLNNRRLFTRLLNQDLEEVKRYNQSNAWLCFIDLDFFKQINDTCGHLAGDEFLRQIAKSIKNAVRDSDHVARIGGDEFAAILRFTTSKQEAIDVAERIRQHLSEMKFNWEAKQFEVTASLGLVYLADCENIDDAFNKADNACYQAKEAGRNKLMVYQQ